MTYRGKEEGRELDAIVAKALGWRSRPKSRPFAQKVGWFPPDSNYVHALPAFSTYIADAMKVVEAMRSKGYHMRLSCVHERREPEIAKIFAPWGCRFIRVVDGLLTTTEHVSTAETPAHAICLSALKAIEAESQSAEKASVEKPSSLTPLEYNHKRIDQ